MHSFYILFGTYAIDKKADTFPAHIRKYGNTNKNATERDNIYVRLHLVFFIVMTNSSTKYVKLEICFSISTLYTHKEERGSPVCISKIHKHNGQCASPAGKITGSEYLVFVVVGKVEMWGIQYPLHYFVFVLLIF